MKALISSLLIFSTSLFASVQEDGSFELESLKEAKMIFDNIGQIIHEFSWRIIQLERENQDLQKQIIEIKNSIKENDSSTILT